MAKISKYFDIKDTLFFSKQKEFVQPIDFFGEFINKSDEEIENRRDSFNGHILGQAYMIMRNNGAIMSLDISDTFKGNNLVQKLLQASQISQRNGRV